MAALLTDNYLSIIYRARPVDVELQTRYIYNSMRLGGEGEGEGGDGEAMEAIKGAARKHAIAVVLGFSERGPSDSLYIAQAIVSARGELVLRRRKIRPTHMERTVFGDGSGGDLDSVAEVEVEVEVEVDLNLGPAGAGRVRVGVLACWEHAMPLLKYHAASQRPAIHVAMWPPLDPATGVGDEGLWSMTAEGCQGLSQTYAVEAAAYVLHATAVCGERGVGAMGTRDGLLCRRPGGGHSCVIGPDGRRLTEPLGAPDAEGIVYADLDLARTVAAKGWLDIVGHYSRPDLLWLGVDRRQKEVVVPAADGPAARGATGPREAEKKGDPKGSSFVGTD